jgi:hypothetical protein
VTQASEGPPRGGDCADGPEIVCFGSEQTPDSTLRQNLQGKFQTSAGVEITCASMRAAELRGCLIREILRAGAIGQQAVASLLDGDDALALANLRRHWIAMRACVAPMAAELDRLNRERAP